MPPRGKKRSLPTGSHQDSARKRPRTNGDKSAVGPSRWSWVDATLKPAEQVTQEHCLWACGFLEQSGYPVCKNKWGIDAKEQEKRFEEDGIVDLTADCDKKGCKENPNCVNYLGQEAWENEEEARKSFLKVAKLGFNPSENNRVEDLPVGLRNLGATCYANAFLQVWFQDLVLRAVVYACQPSIPEGEGKTVEDAPIYQLQATFAALQQCRQKVYSPYKLVESLQLRTAEQQDATEFSKLFMGMIDNELEKQDVPGLKALMRDQFEGELAYCTTCRNCRWTSQTASKVHELEITLGNDGKLEQRIQEMLKKEELTGDNKYACEKCASLQDATRFQKILDLPNVLHFSLMRFKFDPETLERKKSKQVIAFPLVLNMSPYVERAGKGTDGYVYDLRCVVLHKGPSAYHGHYEAQVFDITKGRWYQFNDETVTPIDSLMDGKPDEPSKPSLGKRKESPTYSRREEEGNKKVKIDVVGSDDEDMPVKKGKGRAVPTIINITDDEEDEKEPEVSRASGSTPQLRYIRSKDAYMLIYVRRQPQADRPVWESVGVPSMDSSAASTSTEPSMDALVPMPPPGAAREVERLNEEHERACEDYLKREQGTIEAFNQIRKIKQEIYSTWQIQSHSEESIVVNATELEKWLGKGLVPPAEPTRPAGKEAPAKESGSGEVAAKESNESDILDVPMDTPAKPSDDTDAPGKDTNDSNSLLSTAEPSPAPPERPALDTDVEPMLSDADSARTLVSSPVPGGDPLCTNWLQGQLNTSSLCEHDLICPPASSLKRITKAAHARLVSFGVEIKPALEHTQVCTVCTEQKLTERLYAANHPQEVAQFNRLNGQTPREGYWVSKAWLRDWRNPKPKMHSYGLFDPAPESGPYRQHTYCEHDGLKVDPKERTIVSSDAYELLRTIFPELDAFSSDDDECLVCHGIHAMSAEDREESRKAADLEKASLKSMWLPNPLNIRPFIPIEGFSYAVVPSNFMRRWRSWIIDSTKNERPAEIDTQRWFCEHDKIVLDPNEPLELDDPEFVLVKAQDWQILSTLYAHGPAIVVESREDDRGRTIIKASVDVCQDCRRIRKSDWVEADITIHFLAPDDPLPVGKEYQGSKGSDVPSEEPKPDMASSPSKKSPQKEPSEGPQTKLDVYGYKAAKNSDAGEITYSGTRKSKRLRQPKQTADKRRLTIHKTDTVKDIKVEINDVFSIPTIYQRLFHNGWELIDNAASVPELGILVHDTIYLREVKPEGEDFRSEDEGPPARKKKREEGRAFGGTLLGGGGSAPRHDQARSTATDPLPSEADALPSADVIAVDDDDSTIPCPACTFLNPAGLSCCTMCDSPFTSA